MIEGNISFIILYLQFYLISHYICAYIFIEFHAVYISDTKIFKN